MSRYEVIRRLKAEVSWGRAVLIHDDFPPEALRLLEVLEEAGDDLNNRYVVGRREHVVFMPDEPSLWFVDVWERDWIYWGAGRANVFIRDVLHRPPDRLHRGLAGHGFTDKYHFGHLTTPAKDLHAYSAGFVDAHSPHLDECRECVDMGELAVDYLYGLEDGKVARETGELPPWVHLVKG